MWRNLQKVIVYRLSSNAALAIAVFVAAVDAHAAADADDDPVHQPSDERAARDRAGRRPASAGAEAPLFQAWNCRSLTDSIHVARPIVPTALSYAVVASVAIHALGVVVPSLRVVFHRVPLTTTNWVAVTALSALIVPTMENHKLVAPSLVRGAR